jgi:predicted  nucleic acid-binding Zn-ribbon protein
LFLILNFYFENFQSEEESNSLQKKIQTIEAELDTVQEQLAEANTKLEAKEKAAIDVSHFSSSTIALDLLGREVLHVIKNF